MNFLRSGVFASPLHILQLKLQPTHIACVLGGERLIRPERNTKGVSPHADGSQEESQEEDRRQEEDQEGEEEEVTSVDSVNVVVFGGFDLAIGPAVSEGKGRGSDAFHSTSRGQARKPISNRAPARFFCFRNGDMIRIRR
jgi:hypothetical protein